MVDDPTFPPLMREKAEVALAARKGKENFVEYEFKDYKGELKYIHCARPSNMNKIYRYDTRICVET